MCPACGGAADKGCVQTREMMIGLREPFAYRRCGECRSLWLVECPSEMASYYEHGYYSLTPVAPHVGPAARHRSALALRLPTRMAMLVAGRLGVPNFALWFSGMRLRKTDKVGDVGSGAGWLQRQLAAFGFRDVWGFDPYMDRDTDAGAVHLRRANLAEVPSGFTLLMAHHSLEHMSDPVAALRSMRDRIVPGGHLLIRLPLAGTYADRTYGPNWVQLDPPRHLCVPSEPGMRRAAERAGLAVARVFYDSYALQFWGSEQYQRNVPMYDPRSVARGSEEVFTATEVQEFERLAKGLNRQRDGDQAGFVLRRSK